jgi:FAD synthetase
MKKVLAFGTFDLLHPGHEFYLSECRRFGDVLHVIVALDSTVEKVKGKLPVHDAARRLAAVNALAHVDYAVLGNDGDKYKVIEEIRPDVVCFGYDQVSFTAGLQQVLRERGLEPEIVRISKSHMPDVYKSSKMRENGAE